MDDLINRLRALSRHEHSDYSIGDEAATALEMLENRYQAELTNAERLAEALRLIAAPKRQDGTWNRDREACRQIAAEALRDHDKEGKDG